MISGMLKWRSMQVDNLTAWTAEHNSGFVFVARYETNRHRPPVDLFVIDVADRKPMYRKRGTFETLNGACAHAEGIVGACAIT